MENPQFIHYICRSSFPWEKMSFPFLSLFTPGSISAASTASPARPVRDPHSAWRQTEEYLSWAENLSIHDGFIDCIYQHVPAMC